MQRVKATRAPKPRTSTPPSAAEPATRWRDLGDGLHTLPIIGGWLIRWTDPQTGAVGLAFCSDPEHRTSPEPIR